MSTWTLTNTQLIIASSPNKSPILLNNDTNTLVAVQQNYLSSASSSTNKEIFIGPGLNNSIVDNNIVLRLNYNESVEETTLIIFKIGDWYCTKKDLGDIATSFSIDWGFCAHCAADHAIACSRVKDEQVKKSRPTQKLRGRKSLKCGCEWHIKYRILDPVHKKLV